MRKIYLHTRVQPLYIYTPSVEMFQSISGPSWVLLCLAGYEYWSKFSMGKTKQDEGLPRVPECSLVPQSYQPGLDCETAEVPTIDLSRLKQNPVQRSPVVESIGNACRRFGFFQVSDYSMIEFNSYSLKPI